MTIESRIVGSNGNYLRVNNEGSMHVILHTHPPSDEAVFTAPFRQYFTTNGLSTGSFDMRVNGATTNVDFYIKAQDDRDIYIKTISVAIGDAGSTLATFGALAALTNGVSFTHNTADLGTITIEDAIKNNLTFVRLSQGSPAFGATTSSFRADVSGGGQDTYLPSIDFSRIFGSSWGLRLRKGSTDNLKFTIRDNLSVGIDQFDIIAYGIQIK